MGKKIVFEREIEFRREPKVIEERKFTDESGAAMFGIILGIIVTIIVAIVAVILVQNGAHP